MPSIRDFSGGVLNQELQNRDNGNGVLIDCKNVLSSWNGELRKRTGTRLLKPLAGNSKLIPYRLPSGDDILLVLKDKVINCYEFINNELTPYTVYADANFPASGWTSNTNGAWTLSANVSSGFEPYMTFVVNGAIAYDSSTIANNGVYFVFENQLPVLFNSLEWTWYNGIMQYQPNIICGDSPKIHYSDDGTNWTEVETTFERNLQTVENAPSWETLVTFNIQNLSHNQTHKYWKVTFSSTYSYGANPNYAVFERVSNVVFTNPGSSVVLNNCPYENEDFENIRWSQNGTDLTMTCKGKQPYQITIVSNVLTESVFTPSDYTAIWTDNGYPTCVTYYQNRLWFGGFEKYPTRVFASAFGEFDKFNIPSPIAATSPIQADGTEISNIIENMWGGNNALYCLSADGISMIDAQGAIVATNQVEFKLRNREPVNSMVPTVKDDIMIYLGRDKRKILVTDYDFVVQRFKANCISDSYNNFLKAGIKELHYIPRKSSLIYGVLENGKWFALLFDIDKGKNALYPFEVSGTIKDLQPMKVGDETKLVILTQTPYYQYVIEEKLPQADQALMDFMSEQEKQDYTANVMNGEQVYLDHSITRVFDTPSAVIDNLPYIAGEQIEVIADGQYLGTYTVLQDENTSICYIELDEPVTNVVMGYKYDSYAVLKFVSPYNLRKFPKEIAVNFINTGYLEFGNTFDSLKSVLNNLVESVNISNKRILMNGNYTKTLDKQTFETPYVIVRSDKGLPFVITGMDYKVDMSNYQGGV